MVCSVMREGYAYACVWIVMMSRESCLYHIEFCGIAECRTPVMINGV